MLNYLIILIGFITRFLPHPANFTAIGAIALFSGYYINNKRIAFLLPLIIMFLSDLIIGFYDWHLLISVYLSFSLVVLLGIIIKKKKWFLALPMSIIGTIVFFLITNWAFWQFTNFYPLNIEGLFSCYIAGIPFVKNALLGDLFYTFIFFSLSELATFISSAKKRANSDLG